MNTAEAMRVARVGVEQVNRLRIAARQQAARTWQLVGNVDDEAAAAFLARIVPLSAAIEAQAAEATRAYLAAYAERDVTIDVAAALATRGTPAGEVWRRPVIAARAALAEGKTWAQAMELGRQRAAGIADDNVGIAARDAGQQAMASMGAVGYRRVPDGQACEWCLIAATQRYSISQLAPRHTGCGCGVAPILGAKDPGQIVDSEALAKLKASGAVDRLTESKRRANERRKLADSIDVHEHGELGPVLTPAGEHFTGPQQLARLVDMLGVPTA